MLKGVTCSWRAILATLCWQIFRLEMIYIHSNLEPLTIPSHHGVFKYACGTFIAIIHVCLKLEIRPVRVP
jgi:hypothetical protein